MKFIEHRYGKLNLSPARAVFLDAKMEKQPSLAARAEARENREKEPLNADTRFSSNPDKNIRMLAERAHPESREEQDRYAAKIKNSLSVHMQDGKTVEQLWKFLVSKNCQTTAIIEGILRFFAGQKGENEIAISEFLKPVRIEAKTSLEKEMGKVRTEQITKTRSDLQTLLAEIKVSNSDLPQLPA